MVSQFPPEEQEETHRQGTSNLVDRMTEEGRTILAIARRERGTDSLAAHSVVKGLARQFLRDINSNISKYNNAFTRIWATHRYCERYASIFCGKDKFYKPVEGWSGEPLAAYLLQQPELGLSEKLKPSKCQKVLKEYFQNIAIIYFDWLAKHKTEIDAATAQGIPNRNFVNFLHQLVNDMENDLLGRDREKLPPVTDEEMKTIPR